MKLSKCNVAENGIEWLANEKSETVKIPLESKLENIQKQTKPDALRKLRSLNGAAHQISKYIKDLARICHPFRTILKKENKFIWTTVHENYSKD